MVKNYVTIALRNLYQHRFYAGLNIFGLAIGLASCLLIFAYVADEVSYDRFHERADAIYRLNWDYKWQGSEGVGPGTPPPLAAALVDEVPEVEAATRIYPVSDMVVRYEDTFFNETQILGADPNFFDFFSFELLEGNPKAALSEPGSVILTQETARKYFGQEPALGKTIRIGEDKTVLGRTYESTFTVTGIVQDPPSTSHMDFDLITSMSSHPEVAFFDWSWVWMQVVTYAMVPEQAATEGAEAKLADVVAARAPGAFERIGFSYEELISNGGRWDFVFQPLTDVYLGSNGIGNRLGPVGNRTYLYVFSVVAIFILLIACINFMNLSTARSAHRAKEVGVRKVLGSARRNLIGQFMIEAMLFSVLAMALAVGLAEAMLVPFRHLAGKPLDLNWMEPAWLPAALVALTLAVGFLAGSYPSLYLSAFKPIDVLKGRITSGRGGRRFRNGLVVLQFAISMALIICTMLVHGQMRFLKRADVGFDQEGILVISNQNDRLGDQTESFKEALRKRPDVVRAALSTGMPPNDGVQDYYKVTGKGDEQYELTSYMVDDDFAATLGLDIVQGRGFSEDRPTTTQGVILNESAVQLFGWEDPIGQTVTYPEVGTYEVIGVVKDFNFRTLHQPIMPFALFHRASESYDIPSFYVVVRVRGEDVANTVRGIEETWTALAPGTPFEYSFLDEASDAAYRSEQRLGSIILTFAGLAMMIACLGLLGLAAFMAEQRTKEIGIRKVLGASVPNIVVLLSKDFVRLVLIALVVATPVAYVAMERWLADFAYRVDLGVGVFALAGGLALAIALLTVSYQAIRAALADPVKSLRYE